MKKIRTRYFKIALCTSLCFSAVFLTVFLMFGRSFAVSHFTGALDTVFSVLVLAAGSFLLFSFLPFFRGDRRWYSISALLTGVFFISAVILWQAPVNLPPVAGV